MTQECVSAPSFSLALSRCAAKSLCLLSFWLGRGGVLWAVLPVTAVAISSDLARDLLPAIMAETPTSALDAVSGAAAPDPDVSDDLANHQELSDFDDFEEEEVSTIVISDEESHLPIAEVPEGSGDIVSRRRLRFCPLSSRHHPSQYRCLLASATECGGSEQRQNHLVEHTLCPDAASLRCMFCKASSEDRHGRQHRPGSLYDWSFLHSSSSYISNPLNANGFFVAAVQSAFRFLLPRTRTPSWTPSVLHGAITA